MALLMDTPVRGVSDLRGVAWWAPRERQLLLICGTGGEKGDEAVRTMLVLV
jgi:hypothetical protein